MTLIWEDRKLAIVIGPDEHEAALGGTAVTPRLFN
jgi:hypothetical protein